GPRDGGAPLVEASKQRAAHRRRLSELAALAGGLGGDRVGAGRSVPGRARPGRAADRGVGGRGLRAAAATPGASVGHGLPSKACHSLDSIGIHGLGFLHPPRDSIATQDRRTEVAGHSKEDLDAPGRTVSVYWQTAIYVPQADG